MPVYPNAPLVLVALEVRYPQLLGEVETAALHRSIRDILPIPDSTTHHTIMLGDAAPVVERRQFPRLTSRDRTTTLVATREALVLETTRYHGYEAHRSLIDRVIGAVTEVLSPDGVLRVGLRFIDEIRVPEVSEPPGDWSDWVAGGLLVPLAPDLKVGEKSLKPQTWQGEAVYDAGGGYAVRLKYGPQVGVAVQPDVPTRRRVQSQDLFFLLDSDGAWAPRGEVPEFRPDRVLAACDTIHELLSALFHAVSTPRLVDEVFMARGQDHA